MIRFQNGIKRSDTGKPVRIEGLRKHVRSVDWGDSGRSLDGDIVPP